MAITYNCPGCGDEFRFADDMRGHVAHCRNCGEHFRVQGESDSISPALEAPPPDEIVIVKDQSPSRVRQGFRLGFGMFFGFIVGGVAVVMVAVLLCVGCLMIVSNMGTSPNKEFGSVAGAVGGAEKLAQPKIIALSEKQESAPLPLYSEATVGGYLAVRVIAVELVGIDLMAGERGKTVLKKGEQLDRPGLGEYLAVRLHIDNRSADRKADYEGWGFANFRTGLARLEDGRGNHYGQINWGPEYTLAGQARAQSIYPRGAVDELLAFEKPIDKSGDLVLTLPQKTLGGEGEIKFLVPKSIIK